jgi:hypothetical protein
LINCSLLHQLLPSLWKLTNSKGKACMWY